jgi:hypothetical protein
MATIVIDGKDQLQQVGLTLGDVRSTYPNCFLIQESGMAIRRPETILENGCKYTLVEAKQGEKK